MIIFLDKEQKIEIFIVIFLLGLIIGGIANTISTTVSTDLSKNDLLKDNSKAWSTVVGIVESIGSLGATFGQFAIGAIQEKSWEGVFILFAVCTFVSSLFLSRVIIREVKEISEIRRRNTHHNRM